MKKSLFTKAVVGFLSMSLCVSSIVITSPKNEVKGDDSLNNYARALQESLYFFDANMCGNDVNEKSVYSWRDDCHLGDMTVNYNGKTVDVSGGYHDAGDHVKFGLPQAYSATMLGLSYLEYGNVYEKYGLSKHYKTIMDRFVDYFKRCTILNSSGNVESFCYQVGKGQTDHAYWGKPEEQDSKQGNRVNQAYFTSASNPATDIVSETAAALAIYYLNYKDAEALNYAKKLFAYAMNNTKAVATDGPIENGEAFYSSGRYADDYCMAAVMLYKATNDNTYSNEYKKYCNKGDGADSCNEWAWLSWDDVSGLALSYGSKMGLYSNPYGDPLKNCFENMKNGSTVTNGYYCLLQWGSARYNANMDAMAFMLGDSSNVKWALGQLDIILGDDSRSYVVGHTNYTLYPHHRAASGYNDVNANGTTKLAHLLVGALVGGPDQSGNFVNNAASYQYSEVAMDYNAGFVLACAGAANYAITQNADNQVTLDDATLSNEFRSEIVNIYKNEAATARGENSGNNENQGNGETEGQGNNENQGNDETESQGNNENQGNGETEGQGNNENQGNDETESQDNNDNQSNDENQGSDISGDNQNGQSDIDNSESNTDSSATSKSSSKTTSVTKSAKSSKIKINLKNKKKYKLKKKVKIKSKYKIKLIKINGKKVKIKKKKKITFKLKKYKKYLKKKKYNKILIKDVKGFKKVIRFKVK